MERNSDGRIRPPGERSLRAALAGAGEPVPFRSPARDVAEQRDRVDDLLSRGDLPGAEQAVEQWLVLAVFHPDPNVWTEAARARAGLLALHGDLPSALLWAGRDRTARAAIERLFGRTVGNAQQSDSRAGDRAHRAVAIRDRAAALELRRQLGQRPADRCLLTERGFGCDLSVPTHLARLALVTGDADAAVAHARHAVELARSMGSRPQLAWAAMALSLGLRGLGEYAESAAARDIALGAGDAVGVLLPPDLPVTNGPRAELVRVGSAWRVESPLGGGEVPALVGVRQLATLLTARRPVSAYELAGSQPVAPPRRGIPGQESRRLFRAWQSESVGSSGMASAWVRLVDSARGAAGLDDQDPPGAVLVPQSVGHNLRRAMEAIHSVAPSLADHLSGSVQTRAWCLYRPAPGTELAWTVLGLAS
ncbi:hypothetical protein [Granulicoccus sp. GXG6511]|uniref:hypothetical protein n=1 Tax=Granulicoccus sp. GXG6511 TaxID=3381351 RepID=UPI003D7D72F1